jgi:type III secretory pathway lipoprotein EscJ
MEQRWTTIYTSTNLYQAEILRQALEANGIDAVLLNKKDSSYQFGEVQVMVPEADFAASTEIIIQQNLNT